MRRRRLELWSPPINFDCQLFPPPPPPTLPPDINYTKYMLIQIYHCSQCSHPPPHINYTKYTTVTGLESNKLHKLEVDTALVEQMLISAAG